MNLHHHQQPDGEQAPEEGEAAYDEEYYDYQEEEEIDYSRPFPAEVPMDANTKMLSSIPLALYYPAVLALAAAGGFVGSAIGRGVPGEWLAGVAAGSLVSTAAAVRDERRNGCKQRPSGYPPQQPGV